MTINCNRYQSKVKIQVPKPYLDYLIDPNLQVVVLSIENDTDRTIHTLYYLLKVSRNKI